MFLTCVFTVRPGFQFVKRIKSVGNKGPVKVSEKFSYVPDIPVELAFVLELKDKQGVSAGSVFSNNTHGESSFRWKIILYFSIFRDYMDKESRLGTQYLVVFRENTTKRQEK
jgi:hypothetical protein